MGKYTIYMNEVKEIFFISWYVFETKKMNDELKAFVLTLI